MITRLFLLIQKTLQGYYCNRKNDPVIMVITRFTNGFHRFSMVFTIVPSNPNNGPNRSCSELPNHPEEKNFKKSTVQFLSLFF